MRSPVFIGILLCGAPALAGPILHEYVPPPGVSEGAPPADPSQPPESIRTDGVDVLRPADGAAPGADERVLGGPGSGFRPDRLTMDRTTTHDGVLHYTAEFNPSVVPFKRMTALDRVAEGYALGVADTTLTEVPVTPGTTPPSRDAFWGSVVVKLQGTGRAVPLPSVAPEARILSYRTTPQVALRFFRDSADNLWVSSRRPGQVRLIFLTDAPRSYFSPRIPAGVLATHLPPEPRPVLPPGVKQAAEQVIARLRVRRDAPLADQLQRLVAYFRSFRAGELPRAEGDTYLDIALSQRGVCRHRAFAFTITAQALGLRARYVQNEAHAFCEVFVPRMGWARVDLGGASSELRVHNGSKRVVHRPGPDPFPRPASFAGSYSSSGQQVTGLDAAQRGRLRSGGTRLRAMQASADGADGEGGGREAGAGTARPGPSSRVDFTRDEGQGPAAMEHLPGPARRPISLSLTSPTRVVFRGQPLVVEGRLSSGSAGAPGLSVDIILSRDGRQGYLVGSLVSDAEGRFSGQLTVPSEVEVGDYRVFAETPGSREYAPARSR